MVGIDASSYVGGVTMHKLYGLPIDYSFDDQPHSHHDKNSDTGQLLAAMDLHIIDENSNVHNLLLMASSNVTSLMANTDLNMPFEGRALILAGDFKQVSSTFTQHCTVHHTALTSAHVPHFHYFTTL